jgi:hypothetical protein
MKPPHRSLIFATVIPDQHGACQHFPQPRNILTRCSCIWNHTSSAEKARSCLEGPWPERLDGLYPQGRSHSQAPQVNRGKRTHMCLEFRLLVVLFIRLAMHKGGANKISHQKHLLVPRVLVLRARILSFYFHTLFLDQYSRHRSATSAPHVYALSVALLRTVVPRSTKQIKRKHETERSKNISYNMRYVDGQLPNATLLYRVLLFPSSVELT